MKVKLQMREGSVSNSTSFETEELAWDEVRNRISKQRNIKEPKLEDFRYKDTVAFNSLNNGICVYIVERDQEENHDL